MFSLGARSRVDGTITFVGNVQSNRPTGAVTTASSIRGALRSPLRYVRSVAPPGRGVAADVRRLRHARSECAMQLRIVVTVSRATQSDARMAILLQGCDRVGHIANGDPGRGGRISARGPIDRKSVV